MIYTYQAILIGWSTFIAGYVVRGLQAREHVADGYLRGVRCGMDLYAALEKFDSEGGGVIEEVTVEEDHF